MPKPRTKKTQIAESEVLRRTLEKVLLHRAGIYLPLRHADLITVEMERAFDAVLLRILGLLDISLELGDPVRGVVELFDHVAQNKRTRFMKPREWDRCRKPKYEELRFVKSLPQSAIDAAPLNKSTFPAARRSRPRRDPAPYPSNGKDA